MKEGGMMEKRISIRCSESEHEEISRLATELNMSITDYLLMVALHSKVSIECKITK